MKRWLSAGAFLGCVPLANWLISNVGLCVPDGPCLAPVGFGYMAPSGVFVVGVSLVLRDAVHEWCGARWVFPILLAGAALSVFVAPAQIAFASGATFVASEGLDSVVFSRVRRAGVLPAVLASGALGLIVDSALFLGLAFGSMEHLPGQILGKTWALMAGIVVLASARRVLAWRR